MDSTPVLYEERHGWNRSVVLTVSIGCLFGIASLIGFAELHLVRLLLIGSLATVGALLNVLSAVVHRVVVRVDEQGLTLGRAAARTPSGGGTAWAEVRAVVIRKIAGKTHIGLVKKYAGIPITEFTDSGTPKADVTVAIALSGFDAERFIEAVHAYGPEVSVIDERPAASPGQRPAATADQAAPRYAKRAMVWAGVAAVAFAGVLVAIAVFQTSPPSGYTVQPGSAGASAALVPPQEIGSRTLLDTNNESYLFHYQPALLPGGPTSSYGTISATYASAGSSPNIDVDGVYAEGASGHRAVFSLSPQSLADLATSTLFPDGAQRYPSGVSGAVLECGSYGDTPQCVWADQSDFVFVSYDGVPGSMAGLAALTPSFADAVEGRGSGQ